VTFDDFRGLRNDQKAWPNTRLRRGGRHGGGYLQRVALNDGRKFHRWHAAHDDHQIIYDEDCLKSLMALLGPL
jgi:hypothetical protein